MVNGKNINNKEQGHYFNNDISMFNEDEESNFDLKEWVGRFLHYWYLFVIAIVVALSFAYLKNRTWKPEYTVESKIIIETSNFANQYNFTQNFGSGIGTLNTNNQLLIISSYDLINRAIYKLPLSIDYYTKGWFKTNSLYGREPIQINLNHISPEAYCYEFRFIPIDNSNYEIVLEDEIGKNNYPNFVIKGQYGKSIENVLFLATIEKLYLPINDTEFIFRFRSIESLESEFYSRLLLNYIGDASSVVSVSLIGNNILRDKDFLDMLSSEFLASNLENKNEEAVRTIDFINEQLNYIADSLKSSEVRLRQYRRENNMVDVNGYTSSILKKLSELDAQRSELNLKEAYFDDLSKYLNKTITEEKIVAPSSLGVSDPILLDLVSQFNDLQQRRLDLGHKNPNYERFSKKMEEVRLTLIEVLSNVRKIHEMQRNAFEVEYSSILTEIKNLPEKELAMINFERAYKVNDNYYTFLLQKQAEAQIRKASNVPDNKILQRARISETPVNGGQTIKTYLIFFILGIILPASFIVLKELLNTTIRTETDINKLTTIPVLGSVGHAQNSAIPMSARSAKSLYTEGFRLIRTRLEFIAKRKKNIVVMVTSAESADGKTHFARDFAGIYAMLSDKVLLIDLDIRNPYLSKSKSLKGRKGIVHAIIGESTIDEIITREPEDKYDVIPAGIIPPNPAELIASDAFKSIVEDLRRRYEYIIIDTSPLGLVSDAYTVCKLSDVNLLITRAGKSNKNILKNFTTQIISDNVSNVYIILNDVFIDGKSKYTYYGSKNKYYHYYSSDSDEKKYYDNEVV